MEVAIDTTYEPAGNGIVTGQGIGDFDFLAGAWKIRHKRLKDGTADEWHQSASSDGGKTWTWNWWMEWTRVRD